MPFNSYNCPFVPQKSQPNSVTGIGINVEQLNRCSRWKIWI